jgi:hypothetical protein
MSPLPVERSGYELEARGIPGMLPAVYDLALRLGADPRPLAAVVHLTQAGRMRASAKARWITFRARQSMRVRTCEFDWRAHAGFGGFLSARDALSAEAGHFEVRALGLFRLVNAEATLELRRGQAMRYLAELAWAPDAILHNPELRWRCDGPDSFVVGVGIGAAAVEVVLDLDREGRIAGAFAPDRPRAEKKTFVPTPWRGRFCEYTCRSGRWVPAFGEVAWEIDGHEFVYWQGALETWEVSNQTTESRARSS